MKYMIGVAVAVTAFLFLNGMSAVHGEKYSPQQEQQIVFVDSAEAEAKHLKAEIERLRSLSNIRDVLEENFSKAPINTKQELAEAIYEASRLYDLDIELVLAVIQTESSYNPRAVSRVGAQGLMQVMPRTGIAMSKEIAIEGFQSDQLFDPRTNVMLGTYYLRKMVNRYKNLDHALMAYNAGPTKLDSALAANDTVSTRYVAKVRGAMESISERHFVGDVAR